MSSTQSLVHTTSHNRFNKKEKGIPTAGNTIDIKVNSLEELTQDEKIKQWTNLLSQYRYNVRFFSKFIENEPYKIEIPPAVSVENESIIYNTNRMEMGKLYEIEFKNEKWALRKNEKTVEFMRFYPDKDE